MCFEMTGRVVANRAARCAAAFVLLLWASGSTARAVVGAVTPFVSIEAESGLLSGGATIHTLVTPTNSDSSPELEASGHSYVQLNATGQSLTITNNTGSNITALNIRYSIADAPAGGGTNNTLNLYVDGVFRQGIGLTSKQSWCYQTSGNEKGSSKDPTYGKPHIFYDETHFFAAGGAIPSGSLITFQQDSTNASSFYWLDVVDLESPPPPLTRPANSLSITDAPYNAIPDNPLFDSTAAIQSCFNNAKSQNKIAWIPPGTFYLNSSSASLSANGITIQGAGMWYSTIYANPPFPASSANILGPTSCTVQDLTFDANAIGPGPGQGNGGGLNVKGNNWVINRVWVQHLGAGIWADGSNGIIENSRTSCTWADGMNINNGNGAAGNNIGNYLTISNCFIRGSGDDGLALNSGNSPGCLQMTNTTVINCTSIAPWWANNLGIYGGVNILVSNNLCMDSVTEFGISVGEFGNSGLPLQSGRVVNNVIARAGCFRAPSALRIGQTHPISNVFIANNIISNSLYAGMEVNLCATNVTIQYNTISAPALDGIDVLPGAAILAILYSNTVSGVTAGHSAFVNESSTFVVVTPKAAAGYSSASGVSAETCIEGGQDLGGISNGSWTAYNSINLTGVNAFVARIAATNAGGNIEIHLDSVGGALVGTCPVIPTGGTQTYQNAYCAISGASGTHTVYLVYTGGAGNLFNVQYFGFFYNPPQPSHQLVPGFIYSLKSVVNGRFVTAPNGGANALIASSTGVGVAENFQVVDAGGGNIGFLALVNSNDVCADNNGSSPLIANRTSVGAWETFTEVDAGNGNIGLRAMNNGKYVTAPNGGANSIIASSTTVGTAESFVVAYATNIPPPTPTGVMATPGPGQITVSWNPSPGGTGYNVKRSTTSGSSYSIVGANVPGTNYTDPGLTNGTTYYYVVSAVNPAGESTNSAEVKAIAGVLSRVGWIASSSTTGGDSPANAIDGVASTRWSTGASQTSGQWFQVDMGTTNTFNEIVLDATASSGDYPRGYQVNVSNDGINWGNPVSSGNGTSAVITITFPNTVARFIRVTQTRSGVTGNYWSIHEFNVFGVSGTAPAAPSGLMAVPGTGQAVLGWNAPVGAAGYNLKRSFTNSGPYSLVVSNYAGSSYTNLGLPNNATYYYVVSAVDAAGEGPDSPFVSATLQLPLPLAAVVSPDGQIQLSWTTNDNGGTFKVYSATNLVSPTWTQVTNSPSLSNGQWTVILPIGTNNSGFYQLQQ
jgi:fibronectin type 3 domain-containing protein